MNVSVLILTLNEEANLPDCLKTLEWCDDVVLLDSCSTDQTLTIAKLKGIRIIQRQFDDWASHQNWAMQNIEFKYEWVFYLDADERMTEALRNEIRDIAVDSERREVAFYCGRENYFMGKWIRHAMPPGMIMRFFRPSKVRFERLVNPIPVIDGKHGYLRNYLLHYNFSKGLAEWFDKHNRYSTLEALEGMKLLRGAASSGNSLFGADAAGRRRALKELSFHLPGRTIVKFLYLYVVRRGFLDGRAGFSYCVLQSIYEYMIAIKMRELERKNKGLPV